MKNLFFIRFRAQYFSISDPLRYFILYITIKYRLLMTASYNIKAISVANLSNVLNRIEFLISKFLNRLRRANALIETLFIYQISSQ
jgi:hypothetical protein